jgi:alcohol dehydrogenase class IV
MTDFTTSRAYRFAGTERVESGVGKVASLAKIASRQGARRIVVATSKSVFEKTPNVDRVVEALDGCALEVFAGCRQHSPESDIFALMRIIEAFRADAVVSLGGSSVFDTVKIACSRAADATKTLPIPQIAIPTTLSAGEFTYGAGYTEEETRTKKLAMDPRAAPRCVILDPAVTTDTPLDLWLSSGIKALDHALEAVWAIRPNPFSDPLALEAIRLFFRYLPQSRDTADMEARAACQYAAWMAITAANGSGMRLSHFLGHQIGARLHIPHGITSCILLPAVMRHLRPQTLEAQCRIAGAMGLDATQYDAETLAAAAADRLEGFIGGLGLPNSVAAAGANAEDVEAITEASYAAARQLGLANDLPQGAESIRQILRS